MNPIYLPATRLRVNEILVLAFQKRPEGLAGRKGGDTAGEPASWPRRGRFGRVGETEKGHLLLPGYGNPQNLAGLENRRPWRAPSVGPRRPTTASPRYPRYVRLSRCKSRWNSSCLPGPMRSCSSCSKASSKAACWPGSSLASAMGKSTSFSLVMCRVRRST